LLKYFLIFCKLYLFSVIFCAHMLNCFCLSGQTRKLDLSKTRLSSGCVMMWNPLMIKKNREKKKKRNPLMMLGTTAHARRSLRTLSCVSQS